MTARSLTWEGRISKMVNHPSENNGCWSATVTANPTTFRASCFRRVSAVRSTKTVETTR